MGLALFSILLVLVVSLAIFATYLLVRILKIYSRARKLETMRGYETILYAALQKLTPEKTMQTLFPHPDHGALEEVLLRMGDEGAEGLKEKIVALYDLAGFRERRTRQLRSRRKSRRMEAARRLGRIGDPGSVDALEGLLDDAREEVREAALFALGRIGTRRALEAMLDGLESGGRWSQEKVAEAVEEAGEESRGVLLELLASDNPRHRAFAAEVLGVVGGEEEALRLEAALANGSVDVRARAAASLGRMGRASFRPALIQALEDPAWEVRAQAARALGRMGAEEDAPLLARALRDPEWWVRNNAAAALRELGAAGECSLVEALWSEDRFARETAAQALEEGGLVERMVMALEGGDAEEEGHAERVIRRMAEIGCVGTISQVFSDLPPGDLKERLSGLLEEAGSTELESLLREDERGPLPVNGAEGAGVEGDQGVAPREEGRG